MLVSVRLVFLLAVYGGAGGLVGYMWESIDASNDRQLLALSEKTATLSEEERVEALAEMVEKGGPAIEMVGSVLLDPELPPMAMLVLQLTSWLLPLLILLVGYNRIAEDIHSRYTRYIMQRVHRGSYLSGKIIGHAVVCLVAVVAMQLVWLLVSSFYDLYGADRMWMAAPRIWLGMVVYVFAYSAYTMMVSTVFGRPMSALLLGTMAMYAVWIGVNMASFFWTPLVRLWLSAWYPALWRLDPVGYVVFVAYGLIFILMAHLVLRRGDL